MRVLFLDYPESLLEERRRRGIDRFDEVWEGELRVAPAPNTMHQDFEASLLVYLRIRWARPRGCRVYPQINVSPPGEPDWRRNYRIPDLVLLTPDRFAIDRGSHFAGAPLAVVEVRSPGDDTDAKFPFYAGLGVPEVWVFDRDSREPELYELIGAGYARRPADADGWLRSPASGVEFRWDAGRPGVVAARVGGDAATEEELPN